MYRNKFEVSLYTHYERVGEEGVKEDIESLGKDKRRKGNETLERKEQNHKNTSISANANGQRDAASRKIDHIALPIHLPGNDASVDCKLLNTPRNVGYYRIFER